MFVINPPYPLADALRAALPPVQAALAQGPGQGWQVEAGDGAGR
jgi:23S rRNA A2030 N6-methylase RlmJ